MNSDTGNTRGTPQFISGFQLSSCCAICSILWIIVCSFAFFCLRLLITPLISSDYLFGIFKLFFLYIYVEFSINTCTAIYVMYSFTANNNTSLIYDTDLNITTNVVLATDDMPESGNI
jgi:hypothetical protein